MVFTSEILITSPHRPRDAFAAACQAAGSSPRKSDFYDYGDACMLIAHEQGASARVAIRFTAIDRAGRSSAPYTESGGEPLLLYYSFIRLTSTCSTADEGMRLQHAALIGKLAPLLDSLSMRWCYRIGDSDDGPWLTSIPAARQDTPAPGSPHAARPAPSPLPPAPAGARKSRLFRGGRKGKQ